jgi:predicted nuclease of predicted toxin-antitoxin system
MKFLCDVHISYKVVNHLNSIGFETIHVNGIMNKWYTKDKDICSYADTNDLIIITKDSDFRDSYFIKNTPKKLIKINLGNISNAELINVLSDNLASIQKLNKEKCFLIEVEKNYISFIKLKE